MNNIAYKIARLEDIDALIKVGDSLFDYPIIKESVEEFILDPRHHMIIAYDEGEVVGIASGFHYIHPDKKPILFVNEVAVLEDFQNLKIGRTLVEKLKLHGKSLGCKEAWIATLQSNMPARKSFIAADGEEEPEAVVLINYKLD